jgi:hypothetical protein
LEKILGKDNLVAGIRPAQFGLHAYDAAIIFVKSTVSGQVRRAAAFTRSTPAGAGFAREEEKLL